MKADLHIHSFYSYDAIAKPESILAAAADRNINIIAITDHDTTAGWKDFNELSKKYPVEIVFGQEIKIYDNNKLVGEVVCTFLKDKIKGHDLQDVISQVKEQDGLVSIAHPFSERRVEFNAFAEITNWTDIAIEILNGRSYNNRDNEMAANLAQRLNTPITAGSDAHTPFEVGSCYLEFMGKTPQDLKEAILHHDVVTNGKPSKMFYSLISGFGRLGIAV